MIMLSLMLMANLAMDRIKFQAGNAYKRKQSDVNFNTLVSILGANKLEINIPSESSFTAFRLVCAQLSANRAARPQSRASAEWSAAPSSPERLRCRERFVGTSHANGPPSPWMRSEIFLIVFLNVL